MKYFQFQQILYLEKKNPETREVNETKLQDICSAFKQIFEVKPFYEIFSAWNKFNILRYLNI